ncbi:hypothetical protein BRE01_17280 [Brevibacillus reuszeri]|uniref:Uncharacterized protein n=1 Tax=Brevibacillus reuszeri TaxID=54915 RepID=A0A0K9Z073_9BACL|nr:hypothetical protein [Brevibacillus reuszeri]KNB74378.1 hypothetical protein ADS79_01360 [Brevibacillus reuszeri]MED1856285.1 hypothetical protein [Brevibacillus reuszeri]GED68026.1 hypothetical protein BRE01_17280 [Brevibacillus reuszeri]
MDKYNSKGYPDPTAAEALINVAREEKATKAFKFTPFSCKLSGIDRSNRKGYPAERLNTKCKGRTE